MHTNGQFLRKGHARQHTAVSCAKMSEPIEMPLGLEPGALKEHVTWGHNITTTWRTQLNHPCAAAMRPFVKSV